MEPTITVLLPQGTKDYGSPTGKFDAAGTLFFAVWATDVSGVLVYRLPKGSTTPELLKNITGGAREMWTDSAIDYSVTNSNPNKNGDFVVFYQNDTGSGWEPVAARFADICVAPSGDNPPPPPPSGGGIANGANVNVAGQTITLTGFSLTGKIQTV